MVDRQIVYTGQIPLDTMILQPAKNTMIGVGALAQAVIGEQVANPAVAVDGFALSPTGPASLVLNVGPGSIYAQGAVDQNAYGSIAADITDTITQQGITFGTTSLTFTPPGTAGFATNYLIQVGLSVQDTTPVVLPYYNASNPAVPWLGPNNTSVSQNTVRQCTALIQAKAGIAASAGTQVTPAPDPGFFGLYAVTVANGATALTSSNWVLVPNAPYVPATLCGMPQAIQSNKWTFGIDTGAANAIVVALNPAPLAITAGMDITVYKGASANTGPASINVNGAGAVSIHSLSGVALVGGEMPGHSMCELAFDGTYWQLKTVASTNFGGPLFDGTATGTNVYSVANLTPSAAALVDRMFLKAGFANPNTGASTLNIGFGANPITFANGTPLIGGEITGQHLFTYNATAATWELLTPTIAPAAVQPSLVHTGSDTSIVPNTIQANVNPPITSYSTGHIYVIPSAANTNTSGMTANFNGIGTRVVAYPDGIAIAPYDVPAGSLLVLVDNGVQLDVITKAPRTVTSVRNLVGSSAGPTKVASWAIEQINALAGLGGTIYVGTSLALSFNGAVNGLNGLDTGSMPASGDISVYAIYNPASRTWACLGTLGSTSNGTIYTGANMPAGYTVSTLIFSGCTRGDTNLQPFYQLDRTVWTKGILVSNSLNSPSYASVGSFVGIVPANAKSFFPNGLPSTTSAPTNLYISPAASYGPGVVMIWSDITKAEMCCPAMPFITPLTAYHYVTVGQTWTLYSIGFTF